jgi:hypothetical protein
MTEKKQPKIELTPEEVKNAFRLIYLEENYAFLEDDLIKLANGFIASAENKIRKAELAECVEFVRSLNTHVAKALDEKRRLP